MDELPVTDSACPGDYAYGWNPLYLPIAYEYRPLFERLAASCEELLHHPEASAEQRSLLSKLHYALRRLPVLTQDIDFIVILAKPHGNSDPQQSFALELSDRYLKVSTTHAVAIDDSGYGSSPRVMFHCTNAGDRHDRGEDGYSSYPLLASWVQQWESLCQDPCARFLIYNVCESFDWRQYEDMTAWERMPSLFDAKDV